MLIRVITVILSLSTAASAFAGGDPDKVVYGRDNRLDVADSTNPTYVKLANSTAAMISTGSLRDQRNGTYTLRAASMAARMNICSYERFSSQLAAASCSGFLVGKNILVTAGHCIENQYDCNGSVWAFDFHQHLIAATSGSAGTTLDAKNVYACRRIIRQELNEATGLDYAIIELDRDVVGREPLKFRTQGEVKRGDKIVVIGHPSGLPTKISDGARVRANRKEAYFEANLDTYAGNSGSAVFNAETGEVEGILVRGATDYKLDRKNGCNRTKRCFNFTCRGEDVTRITQVPIPN